MRMVWVGAAALVAVAGLIWGFSPREDDVGTDMASVTLPESLSADAAQGKTAYDANCASCHGPNAAGQEGVAPPLVHIIYEPSHHGDESFQRAAKLGVRAHHWSFGDMPPVAGVTPSDVTMIINYIRTLQRANGIH